MPKEPTDKVNPQLENGEWFPIRNDIWEAVQRTKFSLHERKILDLIIRLTYGCNQKVCFLDSYKKLQEASCLYGVEGRKALESLEDKKVLIIDWRHKAALFNKYYNLWQAENYACFKQKTLDLLVQKNLNHNEVSSVVTGLVNKLNQLKISETVKNKRNGQTKITEPVKNNRLKITEPVILTSEKVNDSNDSDDLKNNIKYIRRKTKEEDPVYCRSKILKRADPKTKNSVKDLFVFKSLEEKENFEDLLDCGIKPVEKAKDIIIKNRDKPGLVRQAINLYLESEGGPGYLIGILKNKGAKL